MENQGENVNVNVHPEVIAEAAANPQVQAAVLAQLLGQAAQQFMQQAAPQAAPAAWAPSPQLYSHDFKGVPFEGKASSERPNAIPLGKWLNLVRGHCHLIEDLAVTLTAGHDIVTGKQLEHFNAEEYYAQPKRSFQDQYLKLMFENRLTTTVWNEVRNKLHAAQMYGALIEVWGVYACMCVVGLHHYHCMYVCIGTPSTWCALYVW